VIPTFHGNNPALSAGTIGQVVLNELDFGEVVQVNTYQDRAFANRREATYVSTIDDLGRALSDSLGKA